MERRKGAFLPPPERQRVSRPDEFMNIEFYDKLTAVTDESRVYRDEPMKQHITFRVGGNADYFVLPKTKEEVKSVIQLCREMEMPYAVIGNGSNLLVGDKGYRGVILQIGREMKEIQTEGNCIKAQAGALLSQIGNTALREGLAGFEFASGIPGQLAAQS